MLTSKRLRMLALVAFVVTSPLVHAQSSQTFEKVLIRAPKPYGKLVSDIGALGGRVKKQFENIDAISAEIPTARMADLQALVAPEAVSKDLIVPAPRAVDSRRGGAAPQTGSPVRTLGSGGPVASITVTPASGFDPYALNAAGINLQKLHNAGFKGHGIIVAVIDSGLKPGYSVSSFYRCDNLVDDNDDGVVEGNCSDPANDPHGTFSAGMIAQHAIFDVTGTPLAQSIKLHLPAALKTQNGKDSLQLVGSAPEASIYAIRVFAVGVGAPESRIIDAIDTVIKLKKQGKVDTKVVNLSLGDSTLFAGRDVFDEAVDKLLENDIVPVVSAGNVGPSFLTISSPSSSFSALGVGASSPAANERIMWDTCDPNSDSSCHTGAGLENRPFAGTQTAYFSSRGPNADGRADPAVVASGFANFGQGYGTPQQINIAAGTSFSAPIVAGVAAILRQAHPGETATQIRNAIIASANPNQIQDGSGLLDRGAGLIDASAADKLLNGHVDDFLPYPDNPSSDVVTNLEHEAGLNVFSGNISMNTGKLKPGQGFDLLYDIGQKTDQVTIVISNFAASANPNPVLGDDLFVNVHSSKTSAIHDIGDYLFSDFIKKKTITINDPEAGVMRITVSGDWFNGGNVSADVTVSSTKDPLPPVSGTGKIKDGQYAVWDGASSSAPNYFPFKIPKGTKRLNFRLDWNDDWSHYPTSDVDMFVVDSSGTLVALIDPNDPNAATPGATLDAPEEATFKFDQKTPAAQTWYVLAFGFSIPDGKDVVQLSITDQDGKVLN